MSLNRPRLYASLSANTLLRTAMTASGSNALIGFYLAALAAEGRAITAQTAGNLNAAFDAAALLLAIPFGILIDRYSPRLVLVLGTVVGAIATQLFGITGVVSIFFLSRILEGIGQSATQPAILSHLTDATQLIPEMRGRVMSWFEISLFLGLALGNLISGPLWQWFDVGAFSILALFYVAAAIVFTWGTALTARSAEMAVSAQERSRAAIEAFKSAVVNPRLRQLALPWLLFNAVVGLWLSQLTFQLNGPPREGQWLVGLLDPTQIAIFLFLYTVVFAIGVYYFGLLIGRVPRVRIMRWAFAAMFGVTICFLLMNSSANWSPAARIAILVPYAVVVAIQGGFAPAALSYLADVAGESGGRGSAMGVYSLLFSTGNIIGSLLGGWVGNLYALNGLSYATFAIGLIGLTALHFLPEEELES